jgi:uncharacterized membrane protein
LTGMERSIALALRGGVLASSCCLAAGLILTLSNIAPVAGSFLLQTGIAILLCTPVARVIVSTYEYAAARDWTFATLTAIVLLELVASGVAALVFNRRL